MRRALPPIPTAALALVLLAAAPGAAEEQVWIELSRPAGETAGPIAFADVRGWAGAGRAREYDVVLVLDVSQSTWLPSGSDVDGDGRVGRTLRSAADPFRNFNPRRLCSDPDDSIRAAEIAAARRFLAALDPERSRMGLVVFSDAALEKVPLGASPLEIEQALDALEEGARYAGGGTHLAAGLRQGLATLEAGRAGGPRRDGALVVLSDGSPNLPGNPRRAERATREEAARVAAAGVRIHALALGEEVMADGSVFREIAEQSGGSFDEVRDPAAVVLQLARVDLSRVAELRVENTSTGEAGRAVRVSPDGRFDGLVPLAPGENRIRVTARGHEGAESAAEQVVRFEPRAPRDAREEQEVAARLEELRARTRGLELGLELERARSRSRQLELDRAPKAEDAPEP